MKALTKNIVISSLGLVLFLGIAFFLVSPQISQVKTLNTALVEKKIEVETLQRQLQAFKTAQSDLARATQKERIANAILPKELMTNVIEQVENSALAVKASEDMSIDDPFINASAQPPMITGLSEVVEVPYRLTVVSGDYTPLIDFFSYLEHLPNFTEVSKMDLSASDDASEISVTIDAVFFSKKEARQTPVRPTGQESTDQGNQ